MAALLSIQNLSLAFHSQQGVTRALDSVSLEIQAGQCVGLVGESGSGKSVTALAVMGLLRQPMARISGGQILFDGKDLLKLGQPAYQSIRGSQIAMIFQEPMTCLNPVATIGSQIDDIVRLHLGLGRGAARQNTLDLLDQVGIARPRQQYRAYPRQLSGGQQQRVMIAMAIACEPALMIADEPTTALDVGTQRQVLDLLLSLRERLSMSLLFISHDLAVVGQVAEQVVVMHQGKVCERGPVERVFARPADPYTRGLLACRPRLDGNPRRLATLDQFIDDQGLARNSEPTATTPWQRAPEPAPPLLTVRGLVTTFQGGSGWGRDELPVRAVDGVDLVVPRGQTLGLVGESGCGKTTLALSIMRLIEPTEGQIDFDGLDVNALNPSALRALRSRLQIIFQDPYSSLNPRLNIEQTLTEAMKIHGLGAGVSSRRQRAVDLLQQVGLAARHLSRYPHEFSGGQRQRICIARALAVEPECIICDECVSSLDVSVQAQILNLLLDLQQDHKLSYLFISHDLSVIRMMADEVAVMQGGRIIERGEPARIYEDPQQAYTRQLLAAVPG